MTVSHPARGAWIEMILSATFAICVSSHPARGAWIEIAKVFGADYLESVAPRMGCVD